MSANRAALIDAKNKQQSATSHKTTALRLAEADHSGNGRVRRLVDLASSIMREAQVLARDKTFADESARLQTIDVSKGIDFYGEVERFEMALIKLALDQTAGNQARAAELLGLRATTLNSKIKVYRIEY
jgi:transcriptional regulator with PAS, ATPase and Fis domain